jgi:hypothetical protein
MLESEKNMDKELHLTNSNIKKINQALDESLFSPPLPVKKPKKFIGVLKNILPYLGSDENKIILAQVIIALKIEGILSSQISNKDIQMISVLKDSIMYEDSKKQQALGFAQKLLE